MDFSDDELAAARGVDLDELLEFARKRQSLDLRQRYGKQMPTAADDAVGEDGSLEETMTSPDMPPEEPIPGVEGEGELAEQGALSEVSGEGSDEELDHEQLRALLAKMTQGA